MIKNFLKNPEYSSIKVVILLLLIVGSGWFILGKNNTGQTGRVVQIEKNPQQVESHKTPSLTPIGLYAKMPGSNGPTAEQRAALSSAIQQKLSPAPLLSSGERKNPIQSIAAFDRAFIAAGLTPAWSFSDDVWRFDNGGAWTNQTQQAVWSHRIANTVTFFNGKLWMIGGYDGSGANGCLNDVWSSIDGGSSWRLEKLHADFAGRYGFVTLVRNGHMFVMGGGSCSGSVYDDMWETSDGINWSLVNTSPLLARVGATAVVYHDTFFIMGGFTSVSSSAGNPNINGYLSSVVTSDDDGQSFTLSMVAPWSPRANLSAVVFNDKIYIMGGIRANVGIYVMPFAGIGMTTTILGDVWSYPGPNYTWVNSTNAPGWGVREGHASVVANGKMWLFGGSASQLGNFVSNDVWYSTNGSAWTQQTANAPWGARSNFGAAMAPAPYPSGNLPQLPTATISQATSTQNSLTLSGVVDPHGSPTTAWFEYVSNLQSWVGQLIPTAMNAMTTPVTFTSPGPITETVNGLIPGTMYGYRLVVQNQRGLSYSSPLVKEQQTSGCNGSSSPLANAIYPNGEEVFTAGQQVTVTWDTCNISPTEILDVSFGGPSYAVLATGVPNTGSATATLPANMPPGQYTMTLYFTNLSMYDVSNSTFQVN